MLKLLDKLCGYSQLVFPVCVLFTSVLWSLFATYVIEVCTLLNFEPHSPLWKKNKKNTNPSTSNDNNIQNIMR